MPTSLDCATFVGVSNSELLKAHEVAAQLNVSGETIRRWAKAGKLRHVKLPSGKVRFRAEDVADFLTVVEPTNPAA